MSCSSTLDRGRTRNDKQLMAQASRPLRRVAIALPPLLLVIAASRLAAQGSEPFDHKPSSSLAGRIDPLISSHKGKVAIAVKNLRTGESFRYHADEVMPTASLIKFPVMIEVYRQAATGKIDLDARLTLRKEDKVPGSGVLTPHFSAGTSFPLRDAVRLMIAFSDNTATNLVLDAIGIGATAATMEMMGYPHTKIHSKVFHRETSVFPERSKQFGLGSTTASEMIRLCEELHFQRRSALRPVPRCSSICGPARTRTSFPAFFPPRPGLLSRQVAWRTREPRRESSNVLRVPSPFACSPARMKISGGFRRTPATCFVPRSPVQFSSTSRTREVRPQGLPRLQAPWKPRKSRPNPEFSRQNGAEPRFRVPFGEGSSTARQDRSRRSAMGFFNALKRLLPHASHAHASEESRQRIRAAWGLDDEEVETTVTDGAHTRPPQKQRTRVLRLLTRPSGRRSCGGSSTNCPVRSRNGTTS